jgi:hypothetical protein
MEGRVKPGHDGKCFLRAHHAAKVGRARRCDRFAVSPTRCGIEAAITVRLLLTRNTNPGLYAIPIWSTGPEKLKGDDMVRTASCHCGQLSVSVEGEPALVSACSCTHCQRRSGSAFGLTSRWTRDQVKSRSGNSVTFTRKGESGGNVECIFCPVCGSTVITAIDLLPDLVGIPVGCFADPAFPEPRIAVWCDTKVEWVQFPPGLLLLRDQRRPVEIHQG